jgi:DNA-binding transcriptional ArsR family regulator
MSKHTHRQGPRPRLSVSPGDLEFAVRLLKAMADEGRLRLLHHLTQREACPADLVAALNDEASSISNRLRVLRAEGLIVRRREGRHLFYALADRHVAELVANAIHHGRERPSPRSS